MKYDKLAVNKIYLILFISILVCAFSVSGAKINISLIPTSPSLLLTSGENMVSGSNEYANITDISAGLGDGSNVTQYFTYFASSPVPYSDLIEGWAFNCYEYNTVLCPYTTNHVGIITGELENVEFPDTYFGGYFDGNNDYVTVSEHEDFAIPDLNNFTMCAVFNTTLTSSIQHGIINKRGTGDGFRMVYKADETVDCIFDGNTGADTLSSTTILNDDELHVVCCRKYSDSSDMWLDGSLQDSASSNYGVINNSFDLFLGSFNDGSNKFEGTIKEIGLFSAFLNDNLMQSFNETKSIGNKSNGQSIQVYFNHTFNTTNNYFLLINDTSPTSSSVRIVAYQNMTHPNSSNYITQRITSGESFVNINGLIYDGYDFPFRLYNIQGRNDFVFNDVYLYESITDTENPSITNCSINTTSVGCGELFRLQCEVSDNQAVQNVIFKIKDVEGNIISESGNQNNGVWYIDKSFVVQKLSSVEINFSIINATDIVGNFNVTYPNLQVNYTCCIENWVASYTNSFCLINDTYSSFVEYTDSNSCGTILYLPEDNGTTTYHQCNYCNSDIVQEKSLCTYQNGTYVRDITYVDNLYSYCCFLTGLASDCAVDYYPYNQTTQEFCTIFNNTMDCDTNTYTEYGFLGDKVRWICYPPVSDNQSTYCMSYVKDPSHGVLQTNPNYITRTDSILSWDNEYEDRTSFEAVGNMVSVYFTKDNLLFDGREYVFGVRCTNNGNFYDYEQLIIPEYENVNAPITRLFWLRWNIVGLFLGGVAMLVIVIIIAGHIRELRRR